MFELSLDACLVIDLAQGIIMSSSAAGLRPALNSAFCKALFLAACCCGVACLAWIVDRLALGVEWSAYFLNYGFFANGLPFVLLFLLLIALFNRLTIATMATGFVTALIYYADHQKLKFLSLPLSFNDVFLLRDVDASTIHLFSNYVNRWYLLATILVVSASIALAFLREPAFFAKKSVGRIFLGVVVLSLSASLLMGGRIASYLYAPDKLRVIPWGPLVTILHSGLLSSIEHSNLEYAHAFDGPVDRKAVKAFDNMFPQTGKNPIVENPPTSLGSLRPDIVIIQSESFFDPVILKDIDNTEQLLPNLHRAMKQATGGTMRTPTFGGGTVRTEFEVLTGIPMDAYPDIGFPYLQINRKSMPSLVSVLHADGYKAYAVHGNSGTFWNRNKAYAAMGFDRFLTKADFPSDALKDGWFISDQAMTDQIIGLLAHASSPALVFAVSIEGHGPYEHVPVADIARRNAIPVPASWPADATSEYRNYAYHISNADQQLGRLWSYLESRHRPFVLAFYGDHLPGLQHVYAIDGFDDRSDGPSQFVPWFVLSSAHAAPQSRHINAWMLGSEVLQAAGLAMPPYYQALGKAEQLLGSPINDNQRKAVADGVDSMARLYLKGKLDEEMPAIRAKGAVK